MRTHNPSLAELEDWLEQQEEKEKPHALLG
jgi:hypothetical protein